MVPATKAKEVSSLSKTKATKSSTGVSKQSKVTKLKHPLFEATPKKWGIGQSIPFKRDMTKVLKWPSYIQLQRKRAILLKKLKIPPALNQFRHTANKNEATQLFRLLAKYRPETKQAKAARLKADADARAKGEESKAQKMSVLIRGLNNVVSSVEHKKAKLVIIAHDVEPIELVVFLPTLCRKMEVPYCIVKGKARLGALTHRKTASVVALDAIRKEDQGALDQLIKNFEPEFINNLEVRRRWGN